MAEVTPKQLKEMRQNHIGRLLLRAYRHFSDLSSAKLRARGHQLGTAALGLIPHIDLGGTRASELAVRADITKQAVGVLVTELEQAGYVIRQSDPSDGRASIISFTPLGWDLLRDAFEIKREIESTYEQALGARRMGQLRIAVQTLVKIPISVADDLPSMGSTSATSNARGSNLTPLK
jgi:DNA-binding MarR family transcriptional regulator